MTLRIEIDIFSGRPNPVLELKGKEAQDALKRLRPARKLAKREKQIPPEPVLGYRGLRLEQVDEPVKSLPRVFRVAGGIVSGLALEPFAAGENFEDLVCGSTGPIKRLGLAKDFPEFLAKEIRRFRELKQKWPRRPPSRPKKTACRCAPLYEPLWWNDGGQKQFNNNCYNYATNYRTDTFAQPGQAAGAMYTALSCASVRPAAIADALINSPAANNKCPEEGHSVALVIAPGWDFHWYRKGRNGYWTHKPGSTPVTNVDNNGSLIADPRMAARGPYTVFCTFMVVMHGHIKIQ